MTNEKLIEKLALEVALCNTRVKEFMEKIKNNEPPLEYQNYRIEINLWLCRKDALQEVMQLLS